MILLGIYFFVFENTYDIMVGRKGEMMRVDEQFMEEVGLGAMPADEKKAFMQHAEEELQVRVGQGIGAGLPDEKMREFDEVTDLNAARNWLEQNVPDYREIVRRVYENFKQEILAERNSILGVAA